MAGGMRNTEQPADQGECNVTRRELEQIAGMERRGNAEPGRDWNAQGTTLPESSVGLLTVRIFLN